jgi:GT2 family glycosyltransferase
VRSTSGKDFRDSSIVSVVLPCYNAASTIAEQLEALESQRSSEPWEVIVVDNRSTDESMAIVERYLGRIPGLRVVKAFERAGRSYARNVGVNAARGSSIAFCDADDVVGTGWLAAIREALSSFDCVACRLDFARLNPAAIAAQHAGHEQRSGLQKAWYPPFLPHAGGGTLAIRRALHEQIGGFDEAFAFLEDTEYCFRVQKAGYGIHFVPEAIVHVRMRPNTSGRFHQIRHWARYNVLVAQRHGDGDRPRIAAWEEYLSSWLRLAKALPKVRSRLEWEGWIWHCGWQVGVLQGVVMGFGSPLALPFGPYIRTAQRNGIVV